MTYGIEQLTGKTSWTIPELANKWNIHRGNAWRRAKKLVKKGLLTQVGGARPYLLYEVASYTKAVVPPKKIEDGYRILEKSETLQEGDEVFYEGKWSRSVNTDGAVRDFWGTNSFGGITKGGQSYGMTYRRKLQSGTYYLAGPMRGIPEYNFPAFRNAAFKLRNTGLTIISPAEMDEQVGFNAETDGWSSDDAADAVVRDVKAIANADGIILLPGWEQSKGSWQEIITANYLGKQILTYDETVPNLTTVLIRDIPKSYNEYIGKRVTPIPYKGTVS